MDVAWGPSSGAGHGGADVVVVVVVDGGDDGGGGDVCGCERGSQDVCELP